MELMAIAGNFQIRPDEFRERGYSAYAEYLRRPRTRALGVSSSVTRATRDIVYGITDYRYSNGVFARYSPVQPLVLLAEADSVYQSLTWERTSRRLCRVRPGRLRAHAGLSRDADRGGDERGHEAAEPPSFDGWLSGVRFFLPHMDLRIDAIYSTIGIPAAPGAPASHLGAATWLAQFHVFL